MRISTFSPPAPLAQSCGKAIEFVRLARERQTLTRKWVGKLADRLDSEPESPTCMLCSMSTTSMFARTSFAWWNAAQAVIE